MNRIECPLCESEAEYLCADLRPVFPEERLLFEVIVGDPLAFIHDSVWAAGSKYYVNGKPISIPISFYESADTDAIIDKLEQYRDENTYGVFNDLIARFAAANKQHLRMITEEAS